MDLFFGSITSYIFHNIFVEKAVGELSLPKTNQGRPKRFPNYTIFKFSGD